ncbi:MAG TPA: hypothetical protein VFB44_00100 [Thermoleophilaceae bacterium]|nr:hypothetical protein [Thermoleophilaceae bacterium]
MKLRATAVLASIIGAFALTASPALAAKPSASTSSIELVPPAAALDATADTSWPRYGDEITFEVKTTATESPFVNLECYQGGALVAQGWEGFFDGALGNRIFGLASPSWTGGEADCTAWLKMYVQRRWKALASTSFHVAE